jgi:hypothetical protein
MAEGALSIGWNEVQVRQMRTTYQTVLGLNMLLHLGIGLACMFIPGMVSSFFGLPQPVPSGWIRGWGATLILVTALYIPGLQDPVRSRAPNLIGVLGRIWMATVWFVVGGGLVWFGAFDALFTLILAVLYFRFCSAYIMSHP